MRYGTLGDQSGSAVRRLRIREVRGGQEKRWFQKGLVYQAEEQELDLEGSGWPLEFLRGVRGRFGAAWPLL